MGGSITCVSESGQIGAQCGLSMRKSVILPHPHPAQSRKKETESAKLHGYPWVRVWEAPACMREESGTPSEWERDVFRHRGERKDAKVAHLLG